jgi:protein involved in polysaccharide export with SLBB domain
MNMTKLCERWGLWAAVCCWLMAGFLLSGCHSPAPSRDPIGAAGPGTGGFEPHRFKVQDKVTVIFADMPTLIPAFNVQVKEDGTVTLLQNESFTFADKTVGELQKEIRDRYVPRFYKYMTVTITPDVQTQFYYVDGEVKAPARQTYIERTTVLKAIASAGGFTDFAKKKGVKLTRQDGRKYTINCVKAREDPALDLEIYPGDKIFVPRKIW